MTNTAGRQSCCKSTMLDGAGDSLRGDPSQGANPSPTSPFIMVPARGVMQRVPQRWLGTADVGVPGNNITGKAATLKSMVARVLFRNGRSCRILTSWDEWHLDRRAPTT